MKGSNIVLLGLIPFLFIFLTTCSIRNTPVATDSNSDAFGNLVYKETVSPNKEYVKSEEDIVTFTIEIYQDENYKISVSALSNSEFFDPTQYELMYDKEISESDIDIKWTTMNGSPNPTADNQLSTSVISISEDEEVFSERKITFGSKAIEIITDMLNEQNHN